MQTEQARHIFIALLLDYVAVNRSKTFAYTVADNNEYIITVCDCMLGVVFKLLSRSAMCGRFITAVAGCTEVCCDVFILLQ